MNEDKLDSMQGQLTAFNVVLLAVIRHLPAQLAHQAADTLEVQLDVLKEGDGNGGAAPGTARARNDMGSLYLQMLRAKAAGQP